MVDVFVQTLSLRYQMKKKHLSGWKPRKPRKAQSDQVRWEINGGIAKKNEAWKILPNTW